MRRHYVDVSHFRSPYDSPTLSLSGLGAALPTRWKPGRQYVDVAHFRAPYDQGYFQDNDLFGLGADEAGPVVVERSFVGNFLDGMLGAALLVSTATLIGVGVGLGWRMANRRRTGDV